MRRRRRLRPCLPLRRLLRPSGGARCQADLRRELVELLDPQRLEELPALSSPPPRPADAALGAASAAAVAAAPPHRLSAPEAIEVLSASLASFDELDRRLELLSPNCSPP